MKQVYIECGCCGHYHRQEWSGDCREDSERFSMNYLEDNVLVEWDMSNIIDLEQQIEEEREREQEAIRLEELNEKLLEFAGFKVLGIVPEGSYWGEMDLTGFAVYPGEFRAKKMPFLPRDLNACLRWLEPELKARNWFIVLKNHIFWHPNKATGFLATVFSEIGSYDAWDEDSLSTAFCKAAGQYIDKEEEKENDNN